VREWVNRLFAFRLYFQRSPEHVEFKFSVGWVWWLLLIALIVALLAGCDTPTNKTVRTCSGPDRIEQVYTRASVDDPWVLRETNVISMGCVN
jgi:hypothetical protein